MNQAALDSAWQSGYCREIILALKDTAEEETKERVAALEKHVPTCSDCRYASILKRIEGTTAKRLGAKAVLNFEQGRDNSHDPMFQEVFGQELEAARRLGWLTSEMIFWMSRMAQRHGKPFPG